MAATIQAQPPSATPARNGARRIAGVIRQSPQTTFQLEAAEEEARGNVRGMEAHGRNAIEIQFFRDEAICFYAVDDAEVAEREQIVREEDREWFLLSKSEAIARVSASERAAKRLLSLSSELLHLHSGRGEELLKQAAPELEFILHNFAVYKPASGTRPMNRAANGSPSRTRQTSPGRRPLPRTPRPPSTFPDDQTSGRRQWERTKGDRHRFQALADALDQTQAAEASARRDIVGQHMAGLLASERGLIEGRSDAARAAEQRVEREGRLAQARAIAQQHQQAATNIQRAARGRQGRKMVQTHRSKVADALERQQQAEAFDNSVMVIQSTGRALLARSNAAEARQRMEAAAQQEARERESEHLPPALRLMYCYGLHEGLEGVTLLCGAFTKPSGADRSAAAPRGETFLSYVAESCDSASPWTSLVLNCARHRPFLQALGDLRDESATFGMDALHAVLDSASLQLAASDEHESHQRGAGRRAKSGKHSKPFGGLDTVARCMQPPDRTGYGSPPLLACMLQACERSHQRLPYCERILSLNGVKFSGPKKTPAPGPRFERHTGLQLLVDVQAEEADPDEDMNLMPLAYLRHAVWSASNGLTHGRIDDPGSPDRWRPYTSVTELFEEERGVVMHRELVDRLDLEMHERNTFAEIARLHRALMEP